MLNKKYCADCYYNALCDYDETCDEYYPINDTAVDSVVDDVVEDSRISFRREWFEYIEAFYN